MGTAPNSNSLLVLRPYMWGGFWVFDDDRVGLVKEPFVNGIPEIIEAALERLNIPLEKAEKGFTMIFSANEFPGHHVKLTKLRPESGGNWYRDQDGREGWLCPALYKYFAIAPDELFVGVSQGRIS